MYPRSGIGVSSVPLRSLQLSAPYQHVHRTIARQPPHNVHQPQDAARKKSITERTLYCVTRCARTLRASHSSAVHPGAYLSASARATAAAICALWAARWCKGTVSLGRVKKTSE